MEEYKYIIGKIHAIDMISQELSNLLEPKEPKTMMTTSHALEAKYNAETRRRSYK